MYAYLTVDIETIPDQRPHVADYIREQIEKDAKEVISKALQRIDWTGTAEREARSMLKGQIEAAFDVVLGGHSHTRRENVRKIINEAALQAIKEGSK